MNRIESLIMYAGQFDLLLDVGCDHGYIGLYALEKTTAKVVFSDISEKCLSKAKANLCEKYERAEFVVCDGVPKGRKADVAIIAGMGGQNIIKILQNASADVDRFVLQPMSNVEKLREYIYTHYKVEVDDVIEECGRFYVVIVIKNEFSNVVVDDKIKYFGISNGEISDAKRRFLQYKRNILQKSIAFSTESVIQLNLIENLI